MDLSLSVQPRDSEGRRSGRVPALPAPMPRSFQCTPGCDPQAIHGPGAAVVFTGTRCTIVSTPRSVMPLRISPWMRNRLLPSRRLQREKNVPQMLRLRDIDVPVLMWPRRLLEALPF